MGDDEIHDLTAAYALDALDERDRDEYEQHLARCERCRAELGGLQEVATMLAYAAEGPAPAAALRGRILHAARAERPNVVPLRPRWAVPTAAVAAVAAVAAIGIGIWSLSLSGDLDRQRSAARSAGTALALIAEPGSRRVEFSGAVDGVVAVTPSGRAAVAFTDLGSAPRGKTYEAWVRSGGKVVAAGVFDGRTAVLTQNVPTGAMVMVTVERDGGVAQPTTEPIALAQV
jgi:anti-sigma factor RsiW